MNEAGGHSIWPEEEEYARNEYIRMMRERCGRFERVFKDSPMNELTEQSYVRQSLGEIVKEKVQTPKGLKEREVEHQRAFREALKLHRKVVVIGRAGRGKTSLLYWAVLTYLDNLEKDETAVVPIFIPLKDLPQMESLENLKEHLDAKVTDERVSKWLWGHVEKGNILLTLDALDEMPRDQRLPFLNDRSILATLVRTLTAPQSRIVLTCRDSVYSELAERLTERKRPGEKEGFVKMELKRFIREQIETYAKQYFQDDQKAPAFLKDIIDPRGGASSSRYTHLAEEPLYLHMLCWLYAGSEA